MNTPNPTHNDLVYLYIVSKQTATLYNPVELPRYYSDTVREESKLSYAVLAFLLQTKFNVYFEAEDILITKEGKPYQKDNKYYFSYAHCPDYIACAVGSEEIGVDIEQPRTVPSKIHSKILTKIEVANKADPLNSWVIKEAYYKLGHPESRITFSRTSTKKLLQQSPSVMLQTSEYICALFHTKKSTKVIIESQLT